LLGSVTGAWGIDEVIAGVELNKAFNKGFDVIRFSNCSKLIGCVGFNRGLVCKLEKFIIIGAGSCGDSICEAKRDGRGAKVACGRVIDEAARRG